MKHRGNLCAVMTGRQGNRHMHIFWGDSVRNMKVDGGAIELFPAGTLVGYRIKNGQHGRSFLFRVFTQTNSDFGSMAALQKVPGVMPTVSILIDRMSDIQRNRLMKVFLFLKHKGLDPATMRDRFYYRSATLIHAKQFNIHDIGALL
jgi:hypothetical protein